MGGYPKEVCSDLNCKHLPDIFLAHSTIFCHILKTLPQLQFYNGNYCQLIVNISYIYIHNGKMTPCKARSSIFKYAEMTSFKRGSLKFCKMRLLTPLFQHPDAR
jgi:hypothetical protein